ncbi:hypothetical protein BY458DRAFT_500407 [Sporodiniella umbellata]|nr:hypothetical protein BY458DRAFT_500407 [Sporodiniella umbellata]
METYNNCIVNNNLHTLKRKLEEDPAEESHSSKRMHFSHKEALSPITTTFQLSPNSIANRANDKLSRESLEEDKMMVDYDSVTDEEESLEMPAAPPLRSYITIVDERYAEYNWNNPFNDEMNWNDQ